MRPLRTAMATQVELGSALTSLAGINEPRSQAAFRHSVINSLSDASRKPGEGPRTLALPEGKGSPATMPSTASRPPWAPKPFSREISSDTFATVKPPVQALRPGSAMPKPPAFAQTSEDAAKGSPGNVPPLLDQKPMDGRSPTESVAPLPFCLSPQANTVILFESRRPGKGRAEEGQLLRSQSEKWPRRQPSPSADLRPVSWAPPWKEASAGGSRGPAGSAETRKSPTLATGTHIQAAPAGFGGPWQGETPPAPPGPRPTKPRPLPTDLTGRLETQEPPWQKTPGPAETREEEEGFLAAAGLSGAAPPGPRPKHEPPKIPLPSAAPSQVGPGHVGQNCTQGEEEEGALPWGLGSQGGCARMTFPLLDLPARPTERESLRGSPRKEARALNIQQRIQVLTAEAAGAKAGGLRRSFRSRPLSADLTKRFSGPIAAGEPKPQREPPEWSRKKPSAGEVQEAPEGETPPAGGADGAEAGVAQTPSKGQGSFAKGRPDAPRTEGDPDPALSPKARTPSTSSTEDGCLKTVRATMFEHHVQRHSLVAGPLGGEPALLSLVLPLGGSLSHGQELRKERIMAGGQWTKASNAREADASGEPGRPRDPRPLTQGEKGDQPASEDSLLAAQRIEPRYEVLQTVGERARSEAVAAVSGGKAVTLRRQRNLRENRRAGGCGQEDQPAFLREGTGPEGSWARQPADSFRSRKDGGTFAPWLETGQEGGRPAPAGVMVGPKVLWGTEAKGWEGGAGGLGPQSSRGQSAPCPGLLFSPDLKPPRGPEEDPEGQKLHSAQEKQEAAAEGKASRGPPMEARWPSSFRDASAHRGPERWRRRTLPHGSARFEVAMEPPQDPTKSASGGDALRLGGGPAAKRSLRGLEARQAEVTSPGSPEKPRSPSEPKATYFAVTCQILEESHTRPERAAAVAAPVSPGRRADPSPGGGGRADTGAGESQAGAQELPQRTPEASAERPQAGAKLPLCPGPRSPPCLAALQPERQQKRPGPLCLGREEEEEEAPDRYRSRAVDIDELMAEYGAEAHRLCARESHRESSFFPGEKWPPRPSISGTLPCGSEQREKASQAPPLETHPQEPRPQWGRPDAEKPPGTRTKAAFFSGLEPGGADGQKAREAGARMDRGGLWKEASPKQWAVLGPAGGWGPSRDWGGGRGGWKVEPLAGAGVKTTDPPAAERTRASESPEPLQQLECPSPHKAHRSPARLSFPLGPQLDQPYTPERPGGLRRSKGDLRDLGAGGLRVEEESPPAPQRSPYLFPQPRSCSFYHERRTDHWPGDHLAQCFGRRSAEPRDTEALVQEADGSFSPEAPSLEGSGGPTQRPSPGRRASLYSAQRAPATDRQEASRDPRSRSLDDSSPEADSASPPSERASPDFPFLEQTPRLDSRVLKSRILLDKRRRQHRTPISQALRRGPHRDAQPGPVSGLEGAAGAWMFRDSAEESPPMAGEEEEPPPAERLPPVQPRLPLFPGLGPSALKAQLRKRPESEERREGGPPTALCKSPKGSFPARGSGGQALGGPPEKEGRAEEGSPAWLMELKSRRKQGQPESPI
ncbi:uncharacterized protein KIAA1671 homolog isoform X4 [Erythrolamprus reginae]|uniref:uncharacterized protein KIAA1671 homolog isoform X4 n=1 Tax=Erythrolamprus reginae TaxID=121349 RepID=UPI00396CE12E